MIFRNVLTRSDDWKGYTAEIPSSQIARTARIGGKNPPSLPEPPIKTLQGVAKPRTCPDTAKLQNPSSPSLDSLKHNCNKRNRRCGCWTIRGPSKQGGWIYKRLGCKAWDCKFCGPRKARRVRNAIRKQAVDLKLSGFLTLTLDHQKCRIDESVKHIRESWRKFRVYLERKFGKSISFITVLEFQKNGYAHLHVLVNLFIPQSWIKEAWQAVGGGMIVDIRKVDIQRIGAYVSKYLGKELFLSKGPRGFRRYTTSQSIKLFEKIAKNGDWMLLKFSLEALWMYFEGKEHVVKFGEDGLVELFETKEMVF